MVCCKTKQESSREYGYRERAHASQALSGVLVGRLLARLFMSHNL
jgi:hypothetical protein